MKYHIEIHGCQMNTSDAERVSTVCERNGYTEVDEWRKADLVIYVSCSIKQKAEDKITGHLKELGKMKRKNPNLKIAITGCMVRQTSTQSDEQRDKILKTLAPVDFVFRMEDLDQLDYILRDKTPIDLGKSFGDPDYMKIEPKLSTSFRAYIPITTGCNNFCSFCIVPYSRGRERSRMMSDIIADAKSMASKGVKELLLLGQNVNSYGNANEVYDEIFKDDKVHHPFTRLLMEVNKVSGIKRIRFTSPHPKDVTEELIVKISELENVCEHIHLPMQSGDNEVLDSMNRGYTSEHYLSLVEMIRKYMPRAGITTDIIVGFCGETKDQFQKTLEVARQAQFDLSYHSMYSERRETFSGRFLDDDVPKEEKSRRYHVLNETIKETSHANNKKYLDEVWEILVEKIDDGLASGKTRTNRTVSFPALDDTKEGDMIEVKITEAREWMMNGVAVGDMRVQEKNQLNIRSEINKINSDSETQFNIL